jgi:hypothetical protein
MFSFYITGKPRCAEQGFHARAIVFTRDRAIHNSLPVNGFLLFRFSEVTLEEIRKGDF